MFGEQNREAYEAFQIEKENELLQKGAAFSLIRSLLYINSLEETKNQVEVIVVTRNNANTGLRVFNSIKHYESPISRGCFTSSSELAPYLQTLDVDLFLTANEKDSQAAIAAGIPAAVLLTENIPDYESDDLPKIRIAFDGDAVLFSKDSELIFKKEGLNAFKETESKKANSPIKEGPFAKFLKKIPNCNICHQMKI